MKNQLILDTDKHENIVLIGIACHLKEYRFCWLLNNQLGIGLTRIKDMLVPASGKKDQGNTFPVFYFEDPNKEEQYYLIGNHGPAGDLLERKPPVDYLLFIYDMNITKGLPPAIKSIKEIGQVLTAFKIPVEKVTNIESILSDLEFLLVDYLKK
jgi:hypothetical protein